MSSPRLGLLQAMLVLEMLFAGLGVRLNGDDGFYITSGYMVMHGFKPFIDFSYFKGPLLPYLLAPVVGVFGPTLLASRLFGIVFLLLTYWSCLKIAEAIWRLELSGAMPLSHLKSTLTLLFILYPELLGALSRAGTKESLASLSCLLAAGGLILSKKKPFGAILAGVFTGISIAIKYTSAIVAAPVLAFLLFSGSAVEIAAYLLAAAATVLVFLAPFLFSGNFNTVAENFFAAVMETKNSELASYLPATTATAFPVLLRFAAKFQLVLLASVGWSSFEVSDGGWRVFLRRPNSFLLGSFIFLTTATFAAVSPAIQRGYMYVPLLLIHSAISVQRLWAERRWPSQRQMLAFLAIVLAINTAFLLPWHSNDAGFTTPSFDAFRYRASQEVRSFCLQHSSEDILYLGFFQYIWLQAGCRLSAYSSMSDNHLRLSGRYTNDRARRYKFLTDTLLLEMLQNREFKTVVFDQGMFHQGVDDSGVNYPAIQAAARARYMRRNLWLFEIYSSPD